VDLKTFFSYEKANDKPEWTISQGGVNKVNILTYPQI